MLLEKKLVKEVVKKKEGIDESEAEKRFTIDKGKEKIYYDYNSYKMIDKEVHRYNYLMMPRTVGDNEFNTI
jgi:hypothetical protein